MNPFEIASEGFLNYPIAIAADGYIYIDDELTDGPAWGDTFINSFGNTFTSTFESCWS